MNSAVNRACVVVVVAWAGTALAADRPSDIDVRAAYCLKLTEASIALMDVAPKAVTPMLESLRSQVKRKQEQKREQLQSYLMTHPAVLDSDAAKEALKTVDADARVDNTGRKSILDACATSCKTTNPPPTQEGRTCIDTCAKESPVVKRLDQCTTADWLPGSAAPK